jgi:hypothetical protein
VNLDLHRQFGARDDPLGGEAEVRRRRQLRERRCRLAAGGTAAPCQQNEAQNASGGQETNCGRGWHASILA